jgi:glycosyltransferase involved in cell wall biosynthesis
MSRTLYIFDQGLKGLVGHYYEYVRSIVEAAQAAGLRCIVGCHEEAGDGSFASIELHPVFRDDVWATLRGEEHHSAASMKGVSARFLEDARRLLERHPIQEGDLVFLPNIARPHVIAAALVAENLGTMGAKIHLMFRYPSSHFEGETAAQAFRRLETAARTYDVSLCTDSHRLAENLASLTSLPFKVFPIPHTWQGQAEHDFSRADDGPLHCVSLGNARDEKGLAEILEAVRLSSNEAWGEKLRFTLQVNDPYQVEDAINAFRSGPADPRTVLIDRALGSEEYAALLKSADVVLVPYWRSIYRERTSGVFLEGLITGKLLLCTRDTWMSDLFDLHGGGVAIEDRSGTAVKEGLRQLVERRAELQDRARRAAAHWRSVHCPANFVAHLTGNDPTPATQINKPGKAAIIFPWGEAVSGKTGASLRLKYFVRYMESVYGEVRIIFAGGGETGGIIGKRSIAEPIHYSEHAKMLHAQLKAVCASVGAPEEDCFHLWFHLWPQHDELFALRCEEMVLWADHVYVDYTYFVPLIDRLCRQHCKRYTLTIHDIVSDQSAGTSFLHQATRSLEFEAARMAPRVICISESDRASLESGGVQAEIIPPMIDAKEAVSPFSSEEARAILKDLYGLDLEKKRLCFFVGSLYGPNVEAAEAVADIARRCQEEAQLRDVFFLVAGSCMAPRRTANFAALGVIEGAALSACISIADVTLIPLLRGTGVSLKTVEGLARGSLLLSTSVGVRGLEVEDGLHCRIEDDLTAFPARIAELLQNPEGAEKMREAARAFGAQFDFRVLMPRYVSRADTAELVETTEEFTNRRQAAISELLPKLQKAAKLSPALQLWKTESIELGANSKESDLAGHGIGETIHSQEMPEIDELDAEWYLSTYPDVAMLGMDPVEHYNWIGRSLRRAPNAGDRKKKVPSLAR